MANIHPHIEAMLNRYDLKKDDPFEVLSAPADLFGQVAGVIRTVLK